MLVETSGAAGLMAEAACVALASRATAGGSVAGVATAGVAGGCGSAVASGLGAIGASAGVASAARHSGIVAWMKARPSSAAAAARAGRDPERCFVMLLP